MTIVDDALDDWRDEAVARAAAGRVADYIPALAGVDPSLFAAVVVGPRGVESRVGCVERVVPMLSIVKVFLLLHLVRTIGPAQVFARVGREPSDLPFHALEQLELDGGRPRNPMINSGAITLCGLLPGRTAEARCEALRAWLCTWGGVAVELDQAVLDSVEARRNERNLALVDRLARAGVVTEPGLVYATYRRVCCLATRVDDLGRLGARIARPPDPSWEHDCRTTLDLVRTCGLYEASARHFARTGLAMKSGVSGLVLGLVPDARAIAVFSPPLDAEGNSCGGLWFAEQVAKAAQR